MRVVYISILPCLNLTEVEVNREYHALCKYCFMVLFILPRDYEQLV